MPHSLREENMQAATYPDAVSISAIPGGRQLVTDEQIRNFELLRLAFFALKLRKLEQRYALLDPGATVPEYRLQRSLLQHAIFQQLLSLAKLGAREQALRLIMACRDYHDDKMVA